MDSDAVSTTGFSQSDSAGVLISVTAGEEALAPLGWEFDSLPELVLGAGSDPEEQFFRISGLRGLPDGHILVVNAGSQELRFFDSEGRLVRNVGEKGEGPGEFLEPALVRKAEADSLLIWDTGLRRLQLFSRNGLDNRTVPLTGWPWGAGRKPPVGALGDKLLVRTTRPLGPSITRRTGSSVDSVSFLWLDPETGDTTHIFARSFPFYFADPPNLFLIPFRVRPLGIVAEDGALVVGGTGPEVRKYGLDGRLLQVLRIDSPNRRVTEEDLRAHVAWEVTPEYYEEMMARYRNMPLPEYLPWFDELQLDESGWVWAEVFEPDRSRPKEWVLFDKDGRARGKVSTPIGLDVQWIGGDRVLGVWTDDVGVEYVHAYRLTRDLGTVEGSKGTDGN